MIKRHTTNSSNISDAVAFILKSSQKRRSIAIATAKAINSEVGVNNKLIALK